MQGEYEKPQSGMSQWSARCAVLDLVEHLIPAAVAELCDEPLRLYQGSGADWQTLRRRWCTVKTCLRRKTMQSNESAHDLKWMHWYPPSQLKFCQALIDWMDNYNLNTDWLAEQFIWLCDWWTQYPKETGKNLWMGLPHTEFWYGDEKPYAFKFEYEMFRWNQQRETAYRKAIKEAFTKELNAYLERMKQQAISAGYQYAQRKNRRVDMTNTRHFEWFVLYQVGKLEYAKIALRYLPNHDDDKAVREAVHSVSKLIDLPLRAPKRGRKPKSAK